MNRRFIRQVGALRWGWRYTLWQWHKRVLQRDPQLALPGGASYRCPRWDPFAAEAFVTRGDVDWGAEDLLAALLRPDQDFLDVGAHSGYYSQRMAPYVRSCHLFEPDPRCADWLRGVCAAQPGFRLWPVAVGDGSGELTLRSDGRGFSHGAGNGDRHQVRLIRLDDHRADFGSVGAIKIDIDGPDMTVLDGATELVRQQRPLLLLEIGNYDPLRLAAWTAMLDYQLLAPREPAGGRFAGLAPVVLDPWLPDMMKMVFAVPRERLVDLAAAAARLSGGVRP